MDGFVFNLETSSPAAQSPSTAASKNDEESALTQASKVGTGIGVSRPRGSNLVILWLGNVSLPPTKPA